MSANGELLHNSTMYITTQINKNRCCSVSLFNPG